MTQRPLEQPDDPQPQPETPHRERIVRILASAREEVRTEYEVAIRQASDGEQARTLQEQQANLCARLQSLVNDLNRQEAAQA